MRKSIMGACLAALLAGANTGVFAIPAKPGTHIITVADGSTVEVRLIGDEYGHLYTSSDGKPLTEVNGIFHYAEIMPDGSLRSTGEAYRPGGGTSVPTPGRAALGKALELRRQSSAMLAGTIQRMKAPASRSAAAGALPGLFPGADYPLTGKPRALVILVEYSDVKMSTDNAHNYFHRMLTQEGFSDYRGTGSALDYFRENSCGLFEPQFDLYGPVTLSQPRKYYGANNSYGEDIRPEQMIIEACQLLDDEVDFSLYDNNGDGRIDNVFVFYAGRGEASGGGTETVWPHSFNISYLGKYMFDGVQLDSYACTNEWNGRLPDGVGTFIHEFSHVMGLPDLYSTSYTASFTPGEWSVLDTGPYNNDGRTPPYYSAFERAALGWLEPAVVDGPANVCLSPVQHNQAAIIRTSDPNEYFLLENRQKTGWDTYIPGHGMLAWHIEYNDKVWAENTINNVPSHQYVDLIEADGTQNEFSRAGDAFPGTSGNSALTDKTTPAMKTAAGQSTGIPITEIKEADGMISFKACGGGEALQPPTALETLVETSAECQITTDGLSITVADSPGTAVLYDLAGRVAATAREGETMYAPTPGVYIICAGATRIKLFLK